MRTLCLRCSLPVLWLTLCGLGAVVAQTQNGAGPQPYSLPRTEVRRIHSQAVELEYVLYVSLPRHYHESTQAYPLLITLDADYAFALAHNVVEHLVDRGDLPEMVIVSIAYDGADENRDVYRRERTRDYTPTHTLEGGYGPEFQKFSGGAEKFRGFITEELIPFLEATYRLKPDDRTLVGHSYGGLFGTYVLLTQPQHFQRYILVSASLWYDNRMIFDLERANAENHKSLPARVFFGVGEQENPLMAEDMRRMVDQLQSRGHQHLRVSSRVFPDENHNSVFPAALTRGLRVVFDQPGSAASQE